MVASVSSHAQGDVYWINFPDPVGSGPGFRRPGVIIQANRLNRSALATVLVCPITSSLKHAEAPGNVLLAKGEANLSNRSVVVVSGTISIDRSLLGKKIGQISNSRVHEILEGLMLLLEPD